MRDLILAAAGVALVATAAAFLLDRDSEDEKRLHAELKVKLDALKRHYASAQCQPVRTQAEEKQFAEDLLKLRASTCRGYLDRLDGTHFEFEALAKRLRTDLADSSISPYRRNALRLLQARLEDACHRLEAYKRYSQWYLGRQDELYRRKQFQALENMPVPCSRLPDDWYYTGKVGLITPSEIGSRNVYGQRLELRCDRVKERYSDAFQRALMLQHPRQQEVPVQLVAAKDPRYFRACVLRGSLYVEHIMERLPCTGVVTRFRSHHSFGDGYEVRCFPTFCKVESRQAASGIRAFLPMSESIFPGKRHPSGERLEVLLHHHDLLLKSSDLTVTQQHESLAIGSTGNAPIILTVDGREHDLGPLLLEAEKSPWQLREVSDIDGSLNIAFQLGPWHVTTTASEHDGQLRVLSIEHVGIDSVELDALPFAVRMVDQRLSALVHVDGLRFNEFLQFCRQLKIFGANDEARRAASEFFQRWNRATDYLLERRAYQTFDLTPTKLMPGVREEELDCICRASLSDAVQELVQDGRKAPRLFIEALHSGPYGERWIQIAELKGIPESLGQHAYRLPHTGIRPPNMEQSFRLAEPAQMRLRIPNGGELANLTRQKRALQTFMGGRLVNRKLQQILLMPELYQAEPDPSWVHRVKGGLAWQDPNWRSPEAACTAKRIVEEALIESNLYLIQGPPGTGKTTCIVELLHQIYAADPDTRVLVVSQQNTAVDNALGRFLRRFPAAAPKTLRVSRDPSRIQDDVRGRATDTVLSEYIIGRQQDYSRSAALGQDIRAAWIHEWMQRVYSESRGSQPFDVELSETLVGDYSLVGATCVGLASRRHGVDRLSFDVCIIDEGGRSTVPELLIPLMRSRKAIIIGDHFQLPPSVAQELYESEARQALPFLEEIEENFLRTSFFEQLYERLPQNCRGRLVEQFRMVEPIGDLVGELFYSVNGKRGLINGRINGQPHDRSHFLDAECPVRWRDVPNGREEREAGVGHSLSNRAEAEAICGFVAEAARSLRSRDHQDASMQKSVAIITPYGAQKRLIRTMLKDRSSIDDVLDIKVDTVDSFQGSEADIVLYSTVRTHGNIRFLLDRQRLNVACSRARENLVFFGCGHFLSRQERKTGQLLFSRIMDLAGFHPHVPASHHESSADCHPTRKIGRHRTSVGT